MTVEELIAYVKSLSNNAEDETNQFEMFCHVIQDIKLQEADDINDKGIEAQVKFLSDNFGGPEECKKWLDDTEKAVERFMEVFKDEDWQHFLDRDEK